MNRNDIKRLPEYSLKNYFLEIFRNNNIYNFNNIFEKYWKNKILNNKECYNINGKALTKVGETYNELLTSNENCEELKIYKRAICKKIKKYADYSMTDIKRLIPFIPINCKETVLGKCDDLVIYKLINNTNIDLFNILTTYEWDYKFNCEFVKCAFNRFIDNICEDAFMRILLPNNKMDLTYTDNNKIYAGVTFFELYFLNTLVENYNNNSNNEKLIFKIFDTNTLGYNIANELGYNILFLTTVTDSNAGGKRRRSKRRKIKQKRMKTRRNNL